MALRAKTVRMAMIGALATGLLGVSAPGVAQAAPTASAAAAGTVTAEEFTGLKRKFLSKKWARWMRTSATLEGTTIYGTTTLEAGALRGFVGCVTVLYLNSSGTAISQSPEHCWGVGAGIEGKNHPSHRVEVWNDPVPAHIAAQTVALDIVQYDS